MKLSWALCHMTGEFMSSISETVCLSVIGGKCDKWHNQYPQLFVGVYSPHSTVGCLRDSRCSQAVSHHKPCCLTWPLWNSNYHLSFCSMLFVIITDLLVKEATPLTDYTFGNMVLLLLTGWIVCPCNHALEVSLIITSVGRGSVLVAQSHQGLDLSPQGLCLWGSYERSGIMEKLETWNSLLYELLRCMFSVHRLERICTGNEGSHFENLMYSH